jgi:osmotically-inducible protein OsmY
MKTFANLKRIAASMLLVAGLSACDKPGPAESIGKNIDHVMNIMGHILSDVTAKVGTTMQEQSKNLGIAYDDAKITTKIKAAILTKPGLDTLNISVHTVQGVVTLSGYVTSIAHRETVNALAMEISGVNQVHNQLVFKLN